MRYLITAAAVISTLSVSIALAVSPAQVVNRVIFYNNSSFDGNNSDTNTHDTEAIAPAAGLAFGNPRQGKVALLPGETASFRNYTSYTRGINGIMFDIEGLPSATNLLTAFDVDFRIGNSSDTSTWTRAPNVRAIVLKKGEGVNGSDRVKVIWPDGAIKNTWLQVTIRANAHTGLTTPDIFYWGNTVGESGNSLTDAVVDLQDELAAKRSPRSAFNPAPIDYLTDFNRDKKVDQNDQAQPRNNHAPVLQLITPR